MSRYKVEGGWTLRGFGTYGNYGIQYADARDTKTGTLFEAGAYRVISLASGKPAKVGKGGTVPFFGETAWSDADRLAYDLHFADLHVGTS